MPYLISILIATLVFFGFLLLTYYESRRGVRFFATARYRLDKRAARAQFLFEHVDWGAFTAHLTKTSLNTVAHDIAHVTLIAVRAVERFLTRAVSALRRNRERDALPSAGASRLQSGMAYLKQNLRPRGPRPRMNDILRRQTEKE